MIQGTIFNTFCNNKILLHQLLGYLNDVHILFPQLKKNSAIDLFDRIEKCSSQARHCGLEGKTATYNAIIIYGQLVYQLIHFQSISPLVHLIEHQKMVQVLRDRQPSEGPRAGSWHPALVWPHLDHYDHLGYS